MLGLRRQIFTQPAGVIKCAGAPQKVMWMVRLLCISSGTTSLSASQALSTWKKAGLREAVDMTFATGMPGAPLSHLSEIYN